MKRIIFIVIVFVMALSFNNSGLMAEELTVVRIEANYPPYEMVIDGKLTGLHIDLVYAVAKRIGIKVNFKSVPWKRAINMVKKGTADAITYIGKTPEREEFIYYNDGNILSSSAYGFIILKNRIDEIKYTGELDSVEGYSIGVQLGYSYGAKFDNAKNLKKHVVNKSDQLIALLLKGRDDLAVIDEPKYLQNRHKEQWSEITFLKPDIINRHFYIGFSKAKTQEALMLKFAQDLTAFKKTTDYQTILKKYRLN